MVDRIPRLIKRRREKGWRLTDHTDNYVMATRPGPWGNPFKKGDWINLGFGPRRLDSNLYLTLAFENWINVGTLSQKHHIEKRFWMRHHLYELKGKDLVCWCADWELGEIDIPQCHAAILMQMANK